VVGRKTNLWAYLTVTNNIMVNKSRITKIAHSVPNSTAAGTTEFQKYIFITPVLYFEYAEVISQQVCTKVGKIQEASDKYVLKHV